MPTNLQPLSETSAIILSSTGSAGDVASAVPFGVYNSSTSFLTGAALQVNFVYKKLGGDVVDIELTNANVYAAYEEACLEYSYIVNMHQGKNILSDALGKVTGTFDHLGDSLSGPSGVNLQYPKITLSYANKVGDSMATMAGFGGTTPIYSASFTTVKNQQDYDLQNIISSSSASGVDDNGGAVPYAGKVGDSRIIIDRVSQCGASMAIMVGWGLLETIQLMDSMLMIQHLRLFQLGKTNFKLLCMRILSLPGLPIIHTRL
jgi:hypothetical protein